MITEKDQDHYYEFGYIIVKQLFSPDQIKNIRVGVQRIIENARVGKSEDIPWINKERGIPERLRNIFQLQYLQPEIADMIENSPIVSIIETLLEGRIRYSLAGMLASGEGKGYAMNWHRDTIPTDGTSQVRLLVKDIRRCCQINVPLFEDHYLKVVPGSHIRNVTEEEQVVLKSNPKGSMPEELIVHMNPGDVAFYFPNLLHTGHNPEGRLRWTLHYAFWQENTPLWSLENPQYDWVKDTDLSQYGPGIRELLERFLKASQI